MKSFLSFISEAKAKQLPVSTQVGEFTVQQWLVKHKKAQAVYNATMNKLTPAQAEKLGNFWQKTWYDAWLYGLYDDINAGKVRPSTIKKLVYADKTWTEKSPELIAKFKAEVAAYAARWANEKDPCKKMFQDKLFQEIHGGSESDTAKEEQIWTQVTKYVSEPGHYGKVKEAYAELLRCKATYKQQLDPNVKTVYRGINITLKTALKLVDFKKLDQTAKISTKQMIGHETKYRPLYPVESWSSNPSIAFKFATGQTSDGAGYYSFSLPELRKDLASLKRYIARKQKLQSVPKDKRGEDYKDDVTVVDEGIRYTIQDNINRYLASDSPVPVVYQITPDKYCVMNPLFSNKISDYVGVGDESEVTRIETNPVAATVWIPKEVVEGAKLIAEIQELIKQAGIKTTQIKVAVPVTLKKGK